MKINVLSSRANFVATTRRHLAAIAVAGVIMAGAFASPAAAVADSPHHHASPTASHRSDDGSSPT